MKTTEQRIAVLHLRTRQLRRRREKTVLSGLALLSLLLFVFLTRLSAVPAGIYSGSTGDSFTGASLLDESIGGYVMTAVLAFMTGVFITAAIIRHRNRNNKNH